MLGLAQAKQIAPAPCPTVHNLKYMEAKWILSARLHDMGEPVLEVTVYNIQAEAAFRIFTSKTRRFSQTLPAGGWGTAKLSTFIRKNSANHSIYQTIPEPFCSRHTELMVCRFLNMIGESKASRPQSVWSRLEALQQKTSHVPQQTVAVRKQQKQAYRDYVLENQPILSDSVYSFIYQKLPF